MAPEKVAPLVAFLVSDENKTNGAVYEVGGGWIGRVRWERAAGLFIPINPEGNLTCEKVKAGFANAVDFDPKKVTFPTTTASQMEMVAKNVPELASRNRLSREEMKAKQGEKQGAKL